MKIKINDKDWLVEIDKELSAELKLMRDEVLERASDILNDDVTIQSLHGIIGGKNNDYVNSVKMQFVDFDDFFAKWLKGFNDKYEKEKEEVLKRYGFIDIEYKASFRNLPLLQDKKIFLYTKKFLERNFYKNIKERTRMKPEEKLWEIWFGNNLVYGLVIAPEYSPNGWRIDKSEIRRVNYDYWTIGHIMHTGLIDANLKKPITFDTVDHFYMFYRSVLEGLSNSKYEKIIYEKYIDYLKKSAKLEEEPFLIPEFRYAGFEKEHKYRIDFTVLNQHSLDFVGFELSPASSHMSIGGLKEKQYKVNEELSQKWEKEMEKRNNYFDTFGVTIKTFTDKHLQDIDNCFEQIIEVLSFRPKNKASITDEENRLKGLD